MAGKQHGWQQELHVADSSVEWIDWAVGLGPVAAAHRRADRAAQSSTECNAYGIAAG
jgi:hypothetical protein